MAKELIIVLENIVRKSVSEEEINYLIKYCIKIAVGQLKSKYAKEIYSFTDLSINDIAIDSITHLFVKNNSGQLGIAVAAESWNSDLEDNSDVDYFLHKIVWKSVTQQVFRLLKEKDPFFEKINRTLSSRLKEFGFKKVKYFGTVYIIKQDYEIGGSLITEKEFHTLPSYLFRKKQFKLINGLIRYIEKNTNHFPAIPFNSLIRKLKLLNSLESVTLEEAITEVSMQDPGVDQILEKSLSEFNSKLKNSYLDKDKISYKEYEIILTVFNSIAHDMKNGGLGGGLYSYFSHYHNISSDEYYEKYNGIMSYMLKHFKEIIKNFLTKN